MRFFLDVSTVPQNTTVITGQTDHYLVVEQPLSDLINVVVYVAPHSRSTLLVMACWETILERLVGQVDAYTVPRIKTSWPILASLLNNGQLGRYRAGVFMRQVDADDGRSKWVVAAIGPATTMTDQAQMAMPTPETLALVINKSLTLFLEVRARKPGLLRLLGKEPIVQVDEHSLQSLIAQWHMRSG